jgi:membrane fusion protein (multidrug efflux system)
VGDYLKDGADIVNLEDMHAMYVDFRLPERWQTKVRRGQVASVTRGRAARRTFSAVVQAIDPLIDANGRSAGRARLHRQPRFCLLRPGMFARVNAVFGERAGAVIPEEAVVSQGGASTCRKLVRRPRRAARDGPARGSHQVGARLAGKVEILRGLARASAW